ncbi:MAG TPA: hypothetical protein VIL46_03005 [Gemmataceae bacterium]
MRRRDEFLLTGAVRPAAASPVRPREGYRPGRFLDTATGRRIPMLAAAVSAERLFDLFLELLRPLGDVVHLVLETSHAGPARPGHDGGPAAGHADLRRSDIDTPVLASYLCEFEDLIVHDGCTGVAALATDRPAEVQLDEHKQLYVYADDLRPFRRLLRRAGVPRVPDLALVSEGDHLHYSDPAFAARFRELAHRLGVGDLDKVFSSE